MSSMERAKHFILLNSKSDTIYGGIYSTIADDETNNNK